MGLGIFVLLVGLGWMWVRLTNWAIERAWARFTAYANDYLESSRRRPVVARFPVDEVGLEHGPAATRCSMLPRPTPVDTAGALRPSCPPGLEPLVGAVGCQPAVTGAQALEVTHG
jgi:hypothetical protein